MKLWQNIETNFFKEQKVAGFIPNSKIVKVASLGFDNFAADIFWLKMIQFLGAHFGSNNDLKGLFEFTDLITDLDKNFKNAYQVGGMLLPIAGQSEKAEIILEKGAQALPYNWEMVWDLAFIKFFYHEKYEEAAQLYEKCSLLPDCLPAAKSMAVNMKNRMGKYELAFNEWKRIYNDENSSEEKRELALKKMEESEKLFNLNRFAQEFKRINNRDIKDLDELKQAFPLLNKDKFISPFENNPFIWREDKKRVGTKKW